MIVTVQFVFCFLKEVFQSLLWKYKEEHSDDHERAVKDMTNEEGAQSVVEFKTIGVRQMQTTDLQTRTPVSQTSHFG